jgi:metal-responsive CopG/Arc/MetJ family transcriptional regulator
MTNIIWYVTEERQKLLDALTEVPEYGRRKRSEIIEMAIREFVEKHGQSNNPQNRLTQYETDGVLAIPSMYEAIDHPEKWETYFKLMKSKKEYKKFDANLNDIIRRANKKFKEMVKDGIH